ncbi:hypothetical protein HDU97_007689 [Phlyctochytrium planicorne]|nr:hypothetical protein HDU97_007689 [Phlyctochytrium planicorne]
MGCGASKAGTATVDTHQPVPTKSAAGQKPSSVKESSSSKQQSPSKGGAGDIAKTEKLGSNDVDAVLKSTDNIQAPKRTKTIAPMIAAFADDGSPVDDHKLAYQGGEGETEFSQAPADEEASYQEPTQWVVLAPGEIPSDVDPESIPKHYFQEEAVRIQKEKEEENKREEEEERKQRLKKIYGVSNPDLTNEMEIDELVSRSTTKKGDAVKKQGENVPAKAVVKGEEEKAAEKDTAVADSEASPEEKPVQAPESHGISAAPEVPAEAPEHSPAEHVHGEHQGSDEKPSEPVQPLGSSTANEQAEASQESPVESI